MNFKLIKVMCFHFTNCILIKPCKDNIATYDITVKLTIKIEDSLFFTKVPNKNLPYIEAGKLEFFTWSILYLHLENILL